MTPLRGDLQQIVEAARQDESLRFTLPARFLQAGERAQALAWIRRLMDEQEGPSGALALARLGRLAYQAAAFGLARACLARARRFDPFSAPVLREKVRQLRLEDRSDRAYDLLRAWQRARGSPAWLWKDLAVTAAESGRMDRAMDAFAVAGGAWGHHQRAEILGRRGELVEAAREHERALEDQPGYLWTRWRRALILASEAALEPALVELAQVDAEARPLTRGLEARWLERLGRRKRALELLLEQVPERWRAAARARLQELRRGGPGEWCVYRGREPLNRLTLTVFGEPTALESLPRVKEWLTQELPGLELAWRASPARPQGLSFHELEFPLARGYRLAVARRLRTAVPDEQEVLVVALRGRPPWAATRGFGSTRLALLEAPDTDAQYAAVLAHELGHAGLGLQHTDGHRFAYDPLSLMGFPGSTTWPLSEAYLSVGHRLGMAAFAGRQERVEEGWECERRGHLQRARRAYLDVLHRNPFDLWVRGRLTRLAAAREGCDPALRELDPLLEWDGGFDLHAWRGELLLKAGRAEQAQLEQLPGRGQDPGAHLATAAAYVRSLDPRAGAFELCLASGLAPTRLEPRLERANLELQRGRFDAAERLLASCLSVRSDFSEAWRLLALLRAEQGRYDEARELVRRGRGRLEECPRQAWHEGQVAWLEGVLPEAERNFRRARRLAPEEAPAHHSLALLWYLQGHLSRARAAWVRCRNIDPEGPLGRAAAGWLAYLRGDAEAARCQAADLLRACPRDGPCLTLQWLAARDGRGRSLWRRRLARVEPRSPALTASLPARAGGGTARLSNQ